MLRLVDRILGLSTPPGINQSTLLHTCLYWMGSSRRVFNSLEEKLQITVLSIILITRSTGKAVPATRLAKVSLGQQSDNIFHWGTPAGYFEFHHESRRETLPG